MVKVLDALLEKGKGLIVEKLRTMQLHGADLQLLIRICIRGRNDSNIENNKRLSTFNYRSRQYYSIEIAILEKQLMYNATIRILEPTLCNLLDLKACCDRELPKLGCIVEEVVGVNRETASRFYKTLPIMQHHMRTDYGISETYYGKKNDKLGGRG